MSLETYTCHPRHVPNPCLAVRCLLSIRRWRQSGCKPNSDLPQQEETLLRQIFALAFIFICTTIAWIVLGATIFSRTYGSNQHLQGHVASTWGTAQEQSPPTATYTVIEPTISTTVENGKLVIRNDKVQRQFPLALEASRIHVNFHLEPRQKGLLWYSTYAVEFSGDYTFRNGGPQTQTVDFRLGVESIEQDRPAAALRVADFTGKDSRLGGFVAALAGAQARAAPSGCC